MDIGLDAHKRRCRAVSIDGEGRVAARETVPTRTESLRDWASRLRPGDRVAVEASSSGRFVHRVLREAGADLRLVHPAGIPAIAKAKVKTDDRDAEVLAHAYIYR